MNTLTSRTITASCLALLGAGGFGALAATDATGAKVSPARPSASIAPVPVISAPVEKTRTAAKSALVRNIELIEEKGGVIVRVHLSDMIEFTHQIEPAKDGKPYRIILDCQNATHSLGANRFMTLPSTVIQSIRTSQFAVKPERVFRVVLDLRKEAFYRIQAADKHIDLFVTDASVKPFDSWSTASFLAAKKASSLAAKSVKQTRPHESKQHVTVVKTSPRNITNALDREKSISVEAGPVKAGLSSSAPKESAKSSPKGAVTSKKILTVASKSDVKKSDVRKDNVKKSEATKIATSSEPNGVNAAGKKTNAVATSGPQDKAAPEKTAKKTEAAAVSKAASPPVVAALPKSAVVSKKAPAVKSLAKKSSPKTKTVKESVADKKTAKKTGARLAAVDKKGPKSAGSPGKSSMMNSKKSSTRKAAKSSSSLFASNVQAAIKPNAIQHANKDKGYSAKFRRSVDRRAIKLKGTQVAEFPKRLTIKYKSRGTRDPFGSLFDKKINKNKNMLDPRPNVESLTMVGVSRDVDGKTRGLFEDIDGRGYILSKGDRVENGAVIKITSKKAYFQIFEYGWSRTIALSLDG